MCFRAWQDQFPILGRNQLEVTDLLPQCRGFVVQYRHSGRLYEGFCVQQEEMGSQGNRPYFSGDLIGHRVEDAKLRRRGKELDKFVCNHNGCGELFQSRAYLNWHRRLVHSEATPGSAVEPNYGCPVQDCLVVCETVSVLVDHLKIAHMPPVSASEQCQGDAQDAGNVTRNGRLLDPTLIQVLDPEEA